MVVMEVEADTEGYRYKMSCVVKGQQVEKAKRTEDTENTINAKYLMAINEALGRMRVRTEILLVLHGSGRHIHTAIVNRWPDRWKEQEWQNARGEPVKNKELWQQYRKMAEGQEIKAVIREKDTALSD